MDARHLTTIHPMIFHDLYTLRCYQMFAMRTLARGAEVVGPPVSNYATTLVQ